MFKRLLVSAFVLLGASSGFSFADPDPVAACLNRRWSTDVHKTADECSMALKLSTLDDKTRSAVLARRAHAYYYGEAYDYALADLDQAVSLDSENVDAISLTLWIAKDQGRVREAEAGFADLIEKYPQSVEGYFGIAAVNHDRQDFPRAIAAYEQMLLVDPKALKAKYAIANIQWVMGNPHAALKTFDELLQADEDWLLDVRFSHPNYFFKGIDFKTAIYLRQYELYASLEQYDEALQSIDKVIARQPKLALAHAWRSSTNQSRGDFRAALQDARKSQLYDPDNICVCGLREEVYSLLGLKLYKDAAERAQFALKLTTIDNRYYATLNRALGDAMKQQGNSQAAFEAYDRSAQADPDIRRTFIANMSHQRYYEGDRFDDYNENLSDALKACALDPECRI